MEEKIGVEIKMEQGVTVVIFEATSITNPEEIAVVSRQIEEFIEENHPEKVVVDFGQVRFFSSQVLGELLKIRAKLEPYGGEVVISAIEPKLHRVFAITNLDKIFRFFPNKDDAVKAMTAN